MNTHGEGVSAQAANTRTGKQGAHLLAELGLEAGGLGLQLGNLRRPNRDLAILDFNQGRQLGVSSLQRRVVLTKTVGLLERVRGRS